MYRHQHPAFYRLFSTKLEVTEIKPESLLDLRLWGCRNMACSSAQSCVYHLTTDSSWGSRYCCLPMPYGCVALKNSWCWLGKDHQPLDSLGTQVSKGERSQPHLPAPPRVCFLLPNNFQKETRLGLVAVGRERECEEKRYSLGSRWWVTDSGNRSGVRRQTVLVAGMNEPDALQRTEPYCEEIGGKEDPANRRASNCSEPQSMEPLTGTVPTEPRWKPPSCTWGEGPPLKINKKLRMCKSDISQTIWLKMKTFSPSIFGKSLTWVYIQESINAPFAM